MGDKIGQSIQEIEIHPLLVKHIPVRHFSVKQGLSHGKIAVGIIPVIAGIKKGGAACKKEQQKACRNKIA